MSPQDRRGRVVLVTGGVRSGKSRYAQELAASSDSVAVIATAEGRDEEMRLRIANHREQRPASWTTVEAPIDLPAALTDSGNKFDTILVDCLTLWASNLLEDERCSVERVLQHGEALVNALRTCRASVILVSNEVGSGIVPDNELSRVYRDALGGINQRIAAAADEVVLLVAGCPLVIKRAGEAVAQ